MSFFKSLSAHKITYFIHFQIVKICTQTLGDILDALQNYDTSSDDISVICEACLRTVIQSVANRSKDDENIQVIASLYINI